MEDKIPFNFEEVAQELSMEIGKTKVDNAMLRAQFNAVVQRNKELEERLALYAKKEQEGN